MIDAFEAVSEDFPLDAQAVIDYFEDTYIGRLRPGGHRRAPLFNMELWNMYNQTIDDLPRTNNAVEGWHRSFQANVGAYHPNFWTLPKPELAILLNLSVADIRTAINGSRTSFRTTPTATLCSIFVGLPTTSACEEHFFSCFRLYATPKRLF